MRPAAYKGPGLTCGTNQRRRVPGKAPPGAARAAALPRTPVNSSGTPALVLGAPASFPVLFSGERTDYLPHRLV